MTTPIDQQSFSSRYINLAHPRLGAKTLSASDEFFAPSERMLNPEPAVFIAGKFDDNGKWMDGWESRRRRTEGHDHCIVKLGKAGVIHGVDIDTSHFCGNHPPSASLEGCYLIDSDPDEDTVWEEVLPAVALEADSHHLHAIDYSETVSHLRLHIYPDGGIARLRVYGTPQCNWEQRDPDQEIDLAAIENGGRPIACSNQAFGSDILNLSMPGRGINMGDGWETSRRREPGNEWVIIALGHVGTLSSIEVDTAHFKGNFPHKVSIQASQMQGGTTQSLITQSLFWRVLLPEQKLQMDHVHRFDLPADQFGPITHIRLNIIPDGGLSRVRLFGKIHLGSGAQ